MIFEPFKETTEAFKGGLLVPYILSVLKSYIVV